MVSLKITFVCNQPKEIAIFLQVGTIHVHEYLLLRHIWENTLCFLFKEDLWNDTFCERNWVQRNVTVILQLTSFISHCRASSYNFELLVGLSFLSNLSKQKMCFLVQKNWPGILNIAKGKTDSEIGSIVWGILLIANLATAIRCKIWPPCAATCNGCKFSHNMTLLMAVHSLGATGFTFWLSS